MSAFIHAYTGGSDYLSGSHLLRIHTHLHIDRAYSSGDHWDAVCCQKGNLNMQSRGQETIAPFAVPQSLLVASTGVVPDCKQLDIPFLWWNVKGPL